MYETLLKRLKIDGLRKWTDLIFKSKRFQGIKVDDVEINEMAGPKGSNRTVFEPESGPSSLFNWTLF